MEREGCHHCGAAEFERLQLQPGFRILTAEGEIPHDICTMLCAHCGLVQTAPQPEEALLTSFYAGQERDVFVEGEHDERIPGEGSRCDQADWIERQLGGVEGLRVLEIGCYDGYLLRLLERRGARGLGVEPSASAAAHGSERWGIEIRAGRFEDQELAPGSFDLIALSHVLEHLTDPRATLERCHRLLAPGGHLFVEVPNVLRPRVESAVNFFTFDHLFNFSPATLSSLYETCGFAPEGLADDFEFPAFRLLGRRSSQRTGPVPADPEAVQACRTAARGFVQARESFVARLRARIDDELPDWLATGKRIAIYGAGYHTECLLELTGLARAKLVALVDGNPAKHGRRVFGLPVIGPEELPDLQPDVIVVSSYDFQDEMLARLARLGLSDVETVAFYPRVTAFSNAPVKGVCAESPT